MNVFSHYCLTFSANDCVFSLNKQQKVENTLIIGKNWLMIVFLNSIETRKMFSIFNWLIKL